MRRSACLPGATAVRRKPGGGCSVCWRPCTASQETAVAAAGMALRSKQPPGDKLPCAVEAGAGRGGGPSATQCFRLASASTCTLAMSHCCQFDNCTCERQCKEACADLDSIQSTCTQHYSRNKHFSPVHCCSHLCCAHLGCPHLIIKVLTTGQHNPILQELQPCWLIAPSKGMRALPHFCWLKRDNTGRC